LCLSSNRDYNLVVKTKTVGDVTRVRTLAMPCSAPPDDVNVDDTPTRGCTAHTHTTLLLTALDTPPPNLLFSGSLEFISRRSGVSRFALDQFNSRSHCTALHSGGCSRATSWRLCLMGTHLSPQSAVHLVSLAMVPSELHHSGTHAVGAGYLTHSLDVAV
jgi:hypothetical protein